MFVAIDDEIIRKTLQKYQSNRLRLTAQDSSSMKSFVGLSDNQYVKLSRGTFYFTGLKLLAPISNVRRLRATRKKGRLQHHVESCGQHDPRDKKGGSIISRRIMVGVITIRPFECMLNVTHLLLKHDALVPSARRFRCPGIIPSNINDVILWKFSADKGGGS